jgi:hypothetical protein
MTGDEQKEARAERAGHDNSQEAGDDEAARAAMLDKQYPTGGPFRRWLWWVAEGATRYGSDGRGITGS